VLSSVQDGIRGLYRGCGVSCCEKSPNLAINFTSFELAKPFFSKWFTDNVCLSPLSPLSAFFPF
jgi:hypothetical protein